MSEEEDCESCKLDVAVGIIDKLCIEKKNGKICDLKIRPLLNGKITLGEYIKSVKVLLKNDRKAMKTIKEVEKVAEEWQLINEKVEAEYVEEQ